LKNIQRRLKLNALLQNGLIDNFSLLATSFTAWLNVSARWLQLIF